MTEQYKIINGNENYSISNLGNVRSNKNNIIMKQWINNKGYFSIGLQINKRRESYKVHRLVALAFIIPIEGKSIVDHIDNNRLNNNVNNLRWASNEENGQNTGVRTDNTSGYKGVSFDKNANKWKVQISIDGIQINLGRFVKKEDAIACRVKKANEAFGIFTNACEKLCV
jgi:hypothetical protein